MNINKKVKLLIPFIIIGIITVKMIGLKETDSKTTLSLGNVNSTLGELYLSETEYKDKINNTVEPYLKSIIQEGYIQGEENINLYYQKYIIPNSKGTIVICHGFTEYTRKYTELIYYFVNKGYSVYIYDQRGHGNSGTLGVIDKTQLHVDKFQNYVLDLKTVLDKVVVPSLKQDEKIFLFAHSMGGCVGTLFLEQYPQYFDAAILSSPMMEVNTGNVPSFIAKLIATTADSIGFGDNYVLGKEKFDGTYDFQNANTSSLSRYEYCYDKLAIEDEYAQRGDSSFHWLKEAFSADKNVLAKDNASKVKIPVLLFQAQNDTMVGNNGQDKFQKNAQNCNLVLVNNTKHDIYRESDNILIPYLNTVFYFYDKQVS